MSGFSLLTNGQLDMYVKAAYRNAHVTDYKKWEGEESEKAERRMRYLIMDIAYTVAERLRENEK